jgi:predicted RNA-binding protein with RPS1 domain
VSSEWVAAIATVLTTLVSAGAGAVVLVINARGNNKLKEAEQEQKKAAQKAKQEQEAAAQKQNEYEKLFARYERDIERREAHADEQQTVVHRLQELNARKREELADLRGRYEIVHGYARRQFDFMRKQGIDPEPPPELPPYTPPADAADEAHDVAFTVKQVDQSAKILKRTRPEPPPELAAPGGAS